MKTIHAYECMDSVSLDKEYLEKLSDGREEISNVIIEVTDFYANQLYNKVNNEFSFNIYHYLKENDYDDMADDYFLANCKCICVEEVEDITYLP